MASPEGEGGAGEVAAASREPVIGRKWVGGLCLTGTMVRSGPSTAPLGTYACFPALLPALRDWCCRGPNWDPSPGSLSGL